MRLKHLLRLVTVNFTLTIVCYAEFVNDPTTMEASSPAIDKIQEQARLDQKRINEVTDLTSLKLITTQQSERNAEEQKQLELKRAALKQQAEALEKQKDEVGSANE